LPGVSFLAKIYDFGIEGFRDYLIRNSRIPEFIKGD
jgi:hypothetical protein